MAIDGQGPPFKPGPSLRGRLIIDTVRGRPRVRPWTPPQPLVPGSRREETARLFGAANRLAKVTHSAWQTPAIETTTGTPWFPRDPLIASLYGRLYGIIMQDGTQVHSMANRNEVSKSLDVLSHTPGKILVRGPHFWQAEDPPKASLDWELLDHWDVAASPASSRNIEFEGASDVMVVMQAVTVNNNSSRSIRIMTGDPATAVETGYQHISTSGTFGTAISRALLHAPGDAAARTCYAFITGANVNGFPKPILTPSRSTQWVLAEDATAPLTGIQLGMTAGDVFTGGDIYTLAR